LGPFELNELVVFVAHNRQQCPDHRSVYLKKLWKIAGSLREAERSSHWRRGKDTATEVNKFWASCDALRSKPLRELAGAVLFPGVEAPYTHVFEMDKTNLAAWRNSAGGAALIVGCIDYTFPEMKTHHQTRFTYGLAKKGTNQTQFNPLDLKPGETSATDLMLIDTPGLSKDAD
jgi:hypothetical protein